SRLAPVMLSGAYLQRAGVFSLQQPMPPGIKPPQHCASPEPFQLNFFICNSCSSYPG
ncbi:TPA: integrase, partial [Escherichia coli]|nr:integrase [Escherichia coli]